MVPRLRLDILGNICQIAREMKGLQRWTVCRQDTNDLMWCGNGCICIRAPNRAPLAGRPARELFDIRINGVRYALSGPSTPGIALQRLGETERPNVEINLKLSGSSPEKIRSLALRCSSSPSMAAVAWPGTSAPWIPRLIVTEAFRRGLDRRRERGNDHR